MPSEDSSAESTSELKPEHRTWTDNTGKYRIEAEFVDFADGTVTLRKTNGKTITLPVERLSWPDRIWMRHRLGQRRRRQ